MFINKFNKLIRNKWFWGIFAGIVCFLFVASDLFRGDTGSRGNTMGTLDGDDVSYQEYQNAYLAARIDDLLLNRGVSRADGDETAKRAWRFLAAAKTASKEGLRVSEQELMQHVSMLFSDETRTFNAAFYAGFVQEQLQCTTAQFEAADRLFLLVGKARTAHGLANWVSSPLVEAQSRGLTDVCTLRTATMENTFANADVDLSEEKVQAYYNRNKAAYRVPEKASVRYIALRIADFADKVEAPSEEDLRFHYDEDPSRYTGEVDGVQTNLSFEAAREKIEAEIRASEAVSVARLAAEEFTEVFYNDSHDKAREAEILAPGFFEARAASLGYTVVTTALFSATEPISGVDRADRAAFSEAAFALDPKTSYECYSDVIVGKELVYVLAYADKQAEHDPEFDAVKADVVAAATREERAGLFAEKLEQTYKAYEAETQKGRTLDDIAQELGLTVSTNMTMTPLEIGNLPGDRFQWITQLPGVNAGESSQFVVYDTGATFVQVLERKEGDATMRSYYQGSLADRIRSNATGKLSENWLEANFQAMNPSIPSLDDEE